MSVSDQLKNELIELIPHMRAFALSLSKHNDIADDLVQETICKAWHKFESFEDGTNLKAWIFTILRNEFYTYFRKRKSEVADIDGKYAARLCSSPAQEAHIELNEVRYCMDKLPAEQREALVLTCVNGISYKEAADILDIAVGTVKSRVCRARSSLTFMMNQNVSEETYRLAG